MEIHLPPAKEAQLASVAAQRGLAADALAQEVITRYLEEGASLADASVHQTISPEDVDRMIDEAFDVVQVPAGVGQGAMRRENWYR